MTNLSIMVSLEGPSIDGLIANYANDAIEGTGLI